MVEDEEHLLEAIKLNLELEGYNVTAVKEGGQAMKIFRQERFNLVILDVMLPGRDGLSVVRQMRERKIRTPVLLLSARGEVSELAEGARLEIACVPKRCVEGSNPSLSA